MCPPAHTRLCAHFVPLCLRGGRTAHRGRGWCVYGGTQLWLRRMFGGGDCSTGKGDKECRLGQHRHRAAATDPRAIFARKAARKQQGDAIVPSTGVCARNMALTLGQCRLVQRHATATQQPGCMASSSTHAAALQGIAMNSGALQDMHDNLMPSRSKACQCQCDPATFGM